MKFSETEKVAKEFLTYELSDGYGETGGISHTGYTLDEYLHDISDSDEDYEAYTEMDMYEINGLLVGSGIEPIPYNLENERRQLACLAAFYLGSETNGEDSLSNMDKCITWANTYDFEMDKDGNIATDIARNDALTFAKSLIKSPMSKEKAKKKMQLKTPSLIVAHSSDEFVRVVKEAYELGYFKITDDDNYGCYGLHCETPHNGFYCLPTEAETWEGTPEEYVKHLGIENVYKCIANTIVDMVVEEYREKDLGEGYSYLLELNEILSDAQNKLFINKQLARLRTY